MGIVGGLHSPASKSGVQEVNKVTSPDMDIVSPALMATILGHAILDHYMQ